MAVSLNTSERIKALQEEIARLEQAEVDALHARRTEILGELSGIDAEIAALTGILGVTKPKGARKEKRAKKQISFNLLKMTLQDTPGKTMNIRREGYDTKQIKSLVVENPEALQLGGRSPWLTVSLVKQ